jgi:hypothetical protein
MLHEVTLREMMVEQSQLAATAVLIEQGLLPLEITENKAFEIFRESRVRFWVEEKQIRWVKYGTTRNSPKWYNFLELKAQQLIDRKFMYPQTVTSKDGK